MASEHDLIQCPKCQEHVNPVGVYAKGADTPHLFKCPKCGWKLNEQAWKAHAQRLGLKEEFETIKAREPAVQFPICGTCGLRHYRGKDKPCQYEGVTRTTDTQEPRTMNRVWGKEQPLYEDEAIAVYRGYVHFKAADVNVSRFGTANNVLCAWTRNINAGSIRIEKIKDKLTAEAQVFSEDNHSIDIRATYYAGEDSQDIESLDHHRTGKVSVVINLDTSLPQFNRR